MIRILLLACLFMRPALGQTAAIWTGAGDGLNYGDPANWDIGRVPLDSVNERFSVLLGEGLRLQFNVAGMTNEVFQLTTGIGSAFEVNPGRKFSVLDEAAIAGLVTTSNSQFIAGSPATRLLSTGRAYAGESGEVILGSSSNLFDRDDGLDVLRSTGNGSVIQFPELQTLKFAGDSPLNVLVAESSSIDFSSVTKVDLDQAEEVRVTADTAASINLESLATISATADSGQLTFKMANGGNIELSSLTKIEIGPSTSTRNGPSVRFMTDQMPFNLPSLQSIEGNVVFEYPAGSRIELPALRSITGSGQFDFSLDVPASAEFAAPELVSIAKANINLGTNAVFSPESLLVADDVDISLGLDAAFDAATLTELTNSTVTLSHPNQFRVPSLKKIDGTDFHISGGHKFRLPIDKLVRVEQRRDNYVFFVEGKGTELDFPTLKLIHNPGRITNITARDYAKVDLSSLESSTGRLAISVSSNAEVDISQLHTMAIGSLVRITLESEGRAKLTSLRDFGEHVQLDFEINKGGILEVGDLPLRSFSDLNVNSIDTDVRILGDLYVAEQGRINLSRAAKVSVSGDMLINTIRAHNMGEGILELVGDELQFFETASEDLGINASDAAGFDIGQLKIGSAEQQATVMLVDLFDNGNRGELGKEALYLRGVNGENGLEIATGSRIILNGLNVYSFQDDEWIHVNALFDPGQMELEFSGGIIAIPEPTSMTLVISILGHLSLLRRRRKR